MPVDDTACYERSPGAALPSQFPADGEAGVTYFTTFRKASARPATRAEMRLEGSTVQAQERCPQSCSHVGVCLQGKGCWCPPGTKGEACEVNDPIACFLGCSGHGTCSRGVCVCDPTHFGLGCTEPMLSDAQVAEKRALVPPRHKLSIYVWDVPTHITLLKFFYGGVKTGDQIARRTFPPRGTPGSNMVEFTFLYELMQDEVHRASSPWAANLFYIPTFFSFGAELEVQRLMYLIGWVRSNRVASERWAQRAGTDFAVWASGDMGAFPLDVRAAAGTPAAASGATQADLEAVIVITHYGHTNMTARDPDNVATHNVNSLRSVIVPELNGDSTYQDCQAMQAVEWPAKRSMLFTFLGNLGHDGDIYAQGVRWRTKRAMANVAGAVFTSGLQGEAFFAFYRNSTFCLAPSGYGHGNRLTFAMLTGCIPVIIQDGVRQSFDDVLPYWEFSLTVPQQEIERLPAILSQIPEHHVELMRHAGAAGASSPFCNACAHFTLH